MRTSTWRGRTTYFTESVISQICFGRYGAFLNHLCSERQCRRQNRTERGQRCCSRGGTLNIGFNRTENRLKNLLRKIGEKVGGNEAISLNGAYKNGGVRRPAVQPLVAGKRRLPDRPRTGTGLLQSADVIADAQPRVRETASRQRARRIVASSREIAGSKRRAACQ